MRRKREVRRTSSGMRERKAEETKGAREEETDGNKCRSRGTEQGKGGKGKGKGLRV